MTGIGIVVHGGAWDIPDDLVPANMKAVKTAASAAYELLRQGSSALDAVEAAVRILEDEPCLNAGRGSELNEAGRVEMDAMIMEGTSLNSGAVACVGRVKNPISLARKVMERTEHTLIVGEGAQRFASEAGVELMEDSYFIDPRSQAHLNKFGNQFKLAVDDSFNKRDHDTVGAVAIDCNNRLACATSTGGITSKRSGRVGDSPIIGSGGYADDNIGAVSCTGHGESISKVCLAKEVINFLQNDAKVSAQQASEAAVQKMLNRVGGRGGVICIKQGGEMGIAFSTSRMAWTAVRNGRVQSGVNRTDKLD